MFTDGFVALTDEFGNCGVLFITRGLEFVLQSLLLDFELFALDLPGVEFGLEFLSEIIECVALSLEIGVGKFEFSLLFLEG